MPKPIQLHIPTPCHEDWAKMQPTERGRHCASCQKTVVDFTGMSDGEIIRHITRAGSGVCGRLLPGQMNRGLVPMSPVQRNGGKGWQLLLAGIMLTADGTMPHPPEIVGAIHLQMPPPPKTDTTENITLGLLAPQIEPGTTIVEVHSPVAAMGDIAIKTDDTIAGIHTLPPDSTTMKIDPSCKKTDDPDYIFTGKIAVSHPNPVQRGCVFHLSWQSEPGTYRVNLLGIGGALIQTRMVQVGSRAQVDTWEIPGGLAAGVYIIQATRPGQPGGFTQKMVVE